MGQLVVLWEENLPFLDTSAVTQEALQLLAWGMPLVFTSATGLAEALDAPNAMLLTVHGSAFPKDAWPAITGFLRRGGSWISAGGNPFTRPCRRNGDGTWYAETPTTAYSKELFINQAFPLDLTPTSTWEWRDALRACQEQAPPVMTRAWALQVRFTDTHDYADEHGSSGTRDAALETQLYARNAEGNRIAAPIVVIDRLRGPSAGGTWALINAELTALPEASLLALLAKRAARGPLEFTVRPSFACYRLGERPTFVTRLKAHRWQGEATLTLRVGENNPLFQQTVALDASPRFLRVDSSETLAPGFHTVHATLSLKEAGEETTLEYETGFWNADESAFDSARPLTVNRDYFERDGKPFPITGTTYMAGDVHRKFLFEPNAAVWDRDFAAMKAAGVNLVRTGIWTAQWRVMAEPGDVDEGVLRAFEAFLLTARKYDIPVTFTFFAFLPEAWNGSNPYLDPRAISAQQEFVAAFAHRFRHVNDLNWDFINEPSFSSLPQIWKTRPNYDAYERAAWTKWLKERASSFTAEEKQADNYEDVWRERWRLTPNMPLDLPTLADFEDRNIFQGTHPLRVLDYKLFAQEMFTRWTKTLVATIRANGNPHQLITVGQDEGGTGDRPNTHFYAEAVDFTTNHSWWLNDDLLWDSVMTKTPNKPTLIQETGIMFAEDVDGGYRRSLTDCANLLARKLALSLAAGGAGAIQWLWNTNVYMDDDNEVGIGFHFADGSEKPELNVFRKFATFLWENRHKLTGRQLEEVVIVVPHSNMFSVRDTATTATKRVVRCLEYSLGVATRTVSEYRIEQIGDPKLIILPAARVITPGCWQALLEKVNAGATLLVTGYVDADPYRRPDFILKSLGLDLQCAPVAQTEWFVDTAGKNFGVRFTGDSMLKLDKAVSHKDEALAVQTLAHGEGKVIFCPLPIESAYEWAASIIYTDVVMDAFGAKSIMQIAGSGYMIRRIELADHTLYLLINEQDTNVHLTYTGTNLLDGDRKNKRADITIEKGMSLEAGQSALVFKARDTDDVTYCLLTGK